MVKILFHTNQLSVRGTEIALYDYAHFNEILLNNQSFIVTKKESHYSDKEAIKKFETRFKHIFFYDDPSEIDKIVDKYNIDVLYCIKSGIKDSIISYKIKTVIHCVFRLDQPHGDVYAAISDQLNIETHQKYPVVPHMIYLPICEDDFREVLNIPKNVIVFGRHGGKETFDIEYVKTAIKDILQTRSDIYFLFLNTNKFYQHKQIIYLDASSDLEYKAKFINSCDAMIHARMGGETFGLACGEFSINNKPVITCNNQGSQNHTRILGQKGIYYHNYQTFFKILNSYDKNFYQSKNWDAYSNEFNPSKVMNIFQKIFLN